MRDSSDAPRDDVYEGRAIVSAFRDRDTAHETARQLHDEGFGRPWIGITVPAQRTAGQSASDTSETRVTPDAESLGEKIGRFFSGESEERTLYDELVRRGVDRSEARRVETILPPHSAILTIDGRNHPELAAQIIEQCGGEILAGEVFAGPAVDDIGERANANALGYGEPSAFARGQAIDEQRRMQLREERLTIDKQRVPEGEAQVAKDVVEHRQDVDVPIIREELFVERRAVSDATAADTGNIAEGEVIRVPLMREQVTVTKRPVVTGEVIVGKRQVSETQRVSETTREERLKVNDQTKDAQAE